MLIDASYASEKSLPNLADRLAPAKVYLDPIADSLAQGVAVVPRRPVIDGASADTPMVLRDVRGDVAFPATVDEVSGVVCLVGAKRPRMLAGNGIEHAQRGAPLAGAVRMRDHRADDQAAAVLHQDMSLVAKDRCRVVALPVKTRVGIGFTGVRVVAARSLLISTQN